MPIRRLPSSLPVDVADQLGPFIASNSWVVKKTHWSDEWKNTLNYLLTCINIHPYIPYMLYVYAHTHHANISESIETKYINTYPFYASFRHSLRTLPNMIARTRSRTVFRLILGSEVTRALPSVPHLEDHHPRHHHPLLHRLPKINYIHNVELHAIYCAAMVILPWNIHCSDSISNLWFHTPTQGEH